jgi:hypothetical protein
MHSIIGVLILVPPFVAIPIWLWTGLGPEIQTRGNACDSVSMAFG